MQIPIISGIYSDQNADFRQSYPHNMVPVAVNQGISSGYLRPADGVSYYPDVGDPPFSTARTFGYGDDRGSINWRDKCYRISAGNLVVLDQNGFIYKIEDTPGLSIAGAGHCTMTYSFDYLAFTSGGNLYLYNPDGTGRVRQNTDTDLGTALDVIYIDGYFMTTDGSFLVVTDLNDPFSVNNLKYGSSEIDPDPIVGLLKLNNEAYAINRYTIEAFYNKGGALFPFARIDGSRMYRGAIGTHAKCIYMDQIAFLGSGKNESPSVYVGINAQTQKIATREIDLLLQNYTEQELKNVVLETRVDKGHNHLFVRLPDITLVYDGAASQATQTPVWFSIDAGPKNLCWANDKWLVGSESGQLGYLDSSLSTLWGQQTDWNFSTKIIYADSRGLIINELELVGIPGRTALGATPTIWTSYSLDGETWSQEWMISAGNQGDRQKRLVWYKQGHMRNLRIQRFRGNSDSHLSFTRLEAQAERLMY